MCYKGYCISKSEVPPLTCDFNPCENDGKCVPNNLNSSFICNCNAGFTGRYFINYIVFNS
jgi:hypothetical protein